MLRDMSGTAMKLFSSCLRSSLTNCSRTGAQASFGPSDTASSFNSARRTHSGTTQFSSGSSALKTRRNPRPASATFLRHYSGASQRPTDRPEGSTGIAGQSNGAWLDLASGAKPYTRDGQRYVRQWEDDESQAVARDPATDISRDFRYHPTFLTPEEQTTLLRLGLWKLDRVDAGLRRTRRRRRSEVSEREASEDSVVDLQTLFELAQGQKYGFEEGHFDSVITQYREALITTLPPSTVIPGLSAVLSKIYRLLPNPPTLHSLKAEPNPSTPPQTSTHALHLASDGQILPHVDNVQASGSVIIGVSLGADRILRLIPKRGEGGGRKVGWDILLKSGSVYVQRDSVRYDYEHSILPYGEQSVWEGNPLVAGHRLSLMIRDAHPGSIPTSSTQDVHL